METKNCIRCYKRLPLADFVKGNSKSGILSFCKCCKSTQDREYRRQNKEKIRKWKLEYRKKHPDRLKKQSDKTYAKHRVKIIKQTGVWARVNRKKSHAHKLVYIAVKCGYLIRLPCHICDNPKVDAHHEDYNKPYEVFWLCRSHHKKRHKELKDQNDN